MTIGQRCHGLVPSHDELQEPHAIGENHVASGNRTAVGLDQAISFRWRGMAEGGMAALGQAGPGSHQHRAEGARGARAESSSAAQYGPSRQPAFPILADPVS